MIDSKDRNREDESNCSLKTEWLTTIEAAAYLKVSVGTLRNMTCNGRVPYFKLDRRNRYRLCDLRGLLLSQRRGGFRGI